MHQTLPPLTRGLIAISDFFRIDWPWILLGFVALAVAAWWALRQPHLRYRWGPDPAEAALARQADPRFQRRAFQPDLEHSQRRRGPNAQGAQNQCRGGRLRTDAPRGTGGH